MWHKLNRWPKMAKNMTGGFVRDMNWTDYFLVIIYHLLIWAMKLLLLFLAPSAGYLLRVFLLRHPHLVFRPCWKHIGLFLYFVWKIYLKRYFTRRQSALVVPYGYICITIISTELWECVKPPLISLDFTRQMRKRCNDWMQFCSVHFQSSSCITG